MVFARTIPFKDQGEKDALVDVARPPTKPMSHTRTGKPSMRSQEPYALGLKTVVTLGEVENPVSAVSMERTVVSAIFAVSRRFCRRVLASRRIGQGWLVQSSVLRLYSFKLSKSRRMMAVEVHVTPFETINRRVKAKKGKRWG